MALSASMGSPPSPLGCPASTLPRCRATKTRSDKKSCRTFLQRKLICNQFPVVWKTLPCLHLCDLYWPAIYLGKCNFLLILIRLFLTKSHSSFMASSQAIEATEAKESIQKLLSFRSLRTLETVSGSSPEWHQYIGQLFNPFLHSKSTIHDSWIDTGQGSDWFYVLSLSDKTLNQQTQGPWNLYWPSFTSNSNYIQLNCKVSTLIYPNPSWPWTWPSPPPSCSCWTAAAPVADCRSRRALEKFGRRQKLEQAATATRRWEAIENFSQACLSLPTSCITRNYKSSNCEKSSCWPKRGVLAVCTVKWSL